MAHLHCGWKHNVDNFCWYLWQKSNVINIEKPIPVGSPQQCYNYLCFNFYLQHSMWTILNKIAQISLEQCYNIFQPQCKCAISFKRLVWVPFYCFNLIFLYHDISYIHERYFNGQFLINSEDICPFHAKSL